MLNFGATWNLQPQQNVQLDIEQELQSFHSFHYLKFHTFCYVPFKMLLNSLNFRLTRRILKM